MGLDVYVGPLARYYSGQWETVMQRWAREHGVSHSVIRHNDQPSPDAEQAKAMVLTWRALLESSLAAQRLPPLDWAESALEPYFTDRPNWDCYSSLLIWAAHDDHPSHPLPETVPYTCDEYPAFQKSQSRTRYSALLWSAEIWLPADFDFTFTAEDVWGNDIGFASVIELNRQLIVLNERTWMLDKAGLDDASRSAPGKEGTLEERARFAFSVFFDLTARALASRLPMKLDY